MSGARRKCRQDCREAWFSIANQLVILVTGSVGGLLLLHFRGRALGLCLVGLLGLIGGGLSALAADPVGSIASVQGNAQVHRAGSVLPVGANMPIMLHDQLVTSTGSNLVLILSDGSRISLGESAKLDVDEHLVGAGGSRSSTVLKLLAGSVHSIVSSGAGRAFNYQIRTSNSVIAVRGTDFEVDFTEGKARVGFNGCGIYTDVRVHTGLVEVENPAHPNIKVEVAGGFATTIPCDAPPLNPGPLGLAAHAVVAGAVNALPPPACPICIMVHPH
jgi:hypothetical protein